MENSIIINDPIIVSFYKENPTIDIVKMNHLLIDMHNSISSNIKENTSDKLIQNMYSAILNLSSEIKSFKSESVLQIFNKLHDIKREMTEELKTILTNQQLSTSEKIHSTIETHTSNMVAKTMNMLNEIIPKTNESQYEKIESIISKLNVSIANDAIKLSELANKDDSILREYLSNVDKQFSTMINNLQQPIFSFIQSSEDRTNNSVNQLKEKIHSSCVLNESLNMELNTFLNKYKHNSSVKGNISETELYHILQQIFPTDEIINCSSETATCDYKVNRKNKQKPTILFENKDYDKTVSTDEINKFERDLNLQKHHGIFISHKSNITYKSPFQIDIIHNIIHIYIPNANYSLEKIKIAVDIIDQLSSQLNSLKNTSETHSISTEQVAELMEFYADFLKQRNIITETVKSQSKLLLEHIEKLNIQFIQKLLNKFGYFQSETEFTCKYCNIFAGKNQASLSAHLRKCKDAQQIMSSL